MHTAVGMVVALALAVLVAPAAWGQAATGSLAMTQDEYVGGRGLITDELATGMFINPTSGILNHLQFTLQYCARIYHTRGPDKETLVGHGAIAGLGLFDWIEIGVAGLYVDMPGPADNPVVGGPTLKARLLRACGRSSRRT
jgi:hypothetical protein